MSDTQRDREERQHVIEVLKQMRLDYEDFWEENDTEEIKAFNYAIASIETDLKYDLLYEETSGQADKRTTKNDLGVREFEEIVVEYPPEDLCTYPEYKGKPYFGIKYKENEKEIVGYGTYKPEVLSQYLKNYFISTTKNDLGVDLISREQAKTAIRDKFKDLPSRVEINTILNELPPATLQEPRKGHWIEHPRTKELRFHHIYECSACKTQIIGNRYNVGNYKYCPHCGAKMVDLQEGEDEE